MTASFEIPATLGACADLLYELKQERLKQQKVVDALAVYESALRDHIIAELPKSEALGVTGHKARVTVVTKDVPTVKDWDALYAHVRETGHFELLQRRLGDKAVAERWDQGVAVPGVEPFTAVTVSLNKI